MKNGITREEKLVVLARKFLKHPSKEKIKIRRRRDIMKKAIFELKKPK